jgi:aminoglycoside phosphotransferase (APT) family kinase protein
MTDNEEVPLEGGERITVRRRGDLVLREAGPWSASVHALLRHLEAAGFDAAPRVVGSGFDKQGREVLSYVEGEVINPAPWSDEAMQRLGEMIRRLHDTTRSFSPPPGTLWRSWFGRKLGTPDLIGHCDAAPWNIVSRAGLPVALIDWEAAGPVDHLTELAMIAWNNAQLYEDDVAEMNGLPEAAVRLRQVRLLADGYRLAPAERRQLADRIIAFAAESAANEVVEQAIMPETRHAPRVWGIAWQTRSVAWLIRNRSGLDRVLA